MLIVVATMRKNVLFYLISFILLVLILLFFNKDYKQLVRYSERTSRTNTVHISFQNLSRQIKSAAILNSGLLKASDSSKAEKLFIIDSEAVIQQLELLKASAEDPVNKRIAAVLEIKIKEELPWIIASNVPDSIIHHKTPGHIAAFVSIDSLIEKGIQRTSFLLEDHKQKSSSAINNLRLWMLLFISLSGILLIYTTLSLFHQQSKRKRKEEELEIVLNRISDGVVSVDNNWRYTFLNDAALTTHPFSREETLGKIIWEVHPQMKGTVFWDKYHEAMLTRKVTEIESHYSPMNIWFSVKVYPSEDGLTIFYKDITEGKKAEQELSKTLKEVTDYKFALDEASIVAITDQKGVIKHANQNFCKISKYGLDELIGQDHRIINSGYHSKEFIKGLWTTIANGKIWKGELKNKAKDGTVYWVDTTIIPFVNEEGKPYQYVAIRADITERKQVEENLRQSLKEIADYKYALDESSIIAITDQKGIITYVNDNFCKISKYSHKELIGQDHRIINSSHHSKEFIRHLWVTIANGNIWKGELKNKAKDGTIYWVDTTIVPFLDDKGKPYQYVAIRADITDRKLAEERLIKSEKIYKTIASSIPGSAICLLDEDYRYLLIEGDMLEKLGYSKEMLLGNKAADVLAPETFASISNEFKKVLQGQTVTGESTRNGYDIISRYVPLKDEDNRVYAVMMVAIDVTELKNAQRDIIELNRGLEEKIIIRTEQLRKSNEELEAFSYSVSHDLRAPLRGIIAFSRILEEEYSSRLDDEARRITSIIRDSTLKMGNLIDDLLAFSRMGKLGITKVQVNTDIMVRQIINEQEQANKQPGSINWEIQNLPYVHADTNTLRQVWINLISNAIKYSGNKERPRIEIGSYPNKGEDVFYIRDNGAGFDEEYKDKLFKVFQRLHDADEFEGTGIGLALVEKIISRHDGKVWAEGKENEGACFYFSIPQNIVL